MKFTEAKLEQAIIELLGEQGYVYLPGTSIERTCAQVLIKEDLGHYLLDRYQDEGITQSEMDTLIRSIDSLPASDLYDSNKTLMQWVSNGYTLKREDHTQKDLHLSLIDYEKPQHNVFKVVNQLEIMGTELRIPDAILYINGMPLVVFEFKSAIRTEANLHSAFEQLTIRYKRDIPELMKYNALCIISDGVNSKMGSLFASYDFYYAWRKVTGDESIAKEGINSLHTMIQGSFDGVWQKLHHALSGSPVDEECGAGKPHSCFDYRQN